MGDTNSSVQSCPFAQDSPEPKSDHPEKTCEYGLVRVFKEGSDHGNPIDIPKDEPGSTQLYEVVSGENGNKSTINIQVGGITVSNCSYHPNKIINLISPAPAAPVTNQDANNTLSVSSNYRFKNPMIGATTRSYDIGIKACQSHSQRITVKSYPDRVFEAEVKAELDLKEESDKSEVGVELTLSGEWDGGKKGELKGSLKKSFEKDSDVEWEFSVSGEWTNGEGRSYYQEFKNYLDLFLMIYSGVTNLEKMTEAKLLGGKAEWKWGIKIDGGIKYSNKWIEEKESFLVAKSSSWEFSRTILEINTEYDFTTQLLYLAGGAWFGFFLEMALISLEKAQRASLTAVVTIKGSLSGNITHTSLSPSDGQNQRVENNTEISGFIGFSITITGKIRIDVTHYGVKAGFKESGIKCTTSSDSFSILFTGLKITAAVFYETTTVASKSNPAPTGLSSKRTEKTNNLELSFKSEGESQNTQEYSKEVELIDEKTLYEFKS